MKTLSPKISIPKKTLKVNGSVRYSSPKSGALIIDHDKALKLILTAESSNDFDAHIREELPAIVSHWLQNPKETPILLDDSYTKKWLGVLRLDCQLQKHNPASGPVKKTKHPKPVHIDFSSLPFEPVMKPRFTFIDLFAGIGGIRYPFQEVGGKCVFTSEWDKFAKKTYAANYGEVPSGDITAIKAADIPNHDILLAGFPCQAFSQAGLKRGFADTRGTMFFEIQRILAEKKPKAFLLENVKQLRGHLKGETLKTIMSILRGEFTEKVPDNVPMSPEARAAVGTKLNYWADYRVLRAADFGVPQNRERLIIVGFLKEGDWATTDFEDLFKWPEPTRKVTSLGQILEPNADVEPKYTLSEKLWSGHQRRKREHQNKGNGFGYSVFDRLSPYTNTISARYYKDGSEILIDQSDIGKAPRKLTPKECAGLQGFPEEFVVDAVSDTQIYKQFGNSVAVPVIRAVKTQMLKTMVDAGMLEDKELRGNDDGQMRLTLMFA